MENGNESYPSDHTNKKTQEITSLNLGGIDTSILHLIIEKLNGDSYREWAQSINPSNLD